MTDNDDSLPLCRICFDTADTPANPLFRPCHCKGTSAWVHVDCLDTWRRTSTNPKSFYECDACKFKYRMGSTVVGDRIFLARLLATAGAIHGLALCALSALVFLMGFVAKAFDPGLTWFEVLRCFNVRHIIAGATTTGLGSLVGWATSLGGLGGGHGWRHIVGDSFGHTGDGGRDNFLGTVIMVIAVLAGLCVAFSWIYARIEEWARRTARHVQHVVLDVQGGAAPAPRPAATAAAAYTPVD